MVKKLSIFFGYVFFFLFALALFIPKSSIYFLLENELANKKVYISQETLKEHIFTLEIEGANISFDSVELAQVQNVEFTFFALYNSIELKNMQLSSLLTSFLPSQIETIEVHYTVFNPLVVSISALGDFGSMQAQFSLKELKIQALIEASELMKKEYKDSLSTLIKNENGEYSYAKTFQF
jgi:hypothetical protein